MHIPPYIEKFSELKGKGVDLVAIIAFNDAWVMSAWGKINGVKGDDIVRTYQTRAISSSLLIGVLALHGGY